MNEEKRTSGKTTGPENKNALRAYLQRAEVRLSTMHRIAGAFLGGAGLLLLLPTFLRDAPVQVFGVINKAVPMLSTQWNLPPLLIGVALSLPVVIAYTIPVYALWLLLQDLTLFYFSVNTPKNVALGKTDKPIFHPRFSLTAIPFSDDEPSDLKKQLRAIQFGSSLKHSVLPHVHKDKHWFKALIEKEKEEEEEEKQVALPDDSWLEECPTDQEDDRSALCAAFGLAGAYNHDLVTEVAKTELSLIRHNLNLKRLVLRYMKALLTLVWTTLLSFMVLAGINDIMPEKDLIVVVLGFLAWAIITPWIVRAPTRWVYRGHSQHAAGGINDRYLARFERLVISGCFLAALITSGIAGFFVGWTFIWLGPVGPGLALARSFGWLKHDLLRWL
jgi:hypothetical protein